ncbi:hypothetical protein PJ985_09615 [Streptomyces sp. ACA25]|uniref:hypothetical protein n=1 Tax=Streptomyces sp. ACA25 TaxID=3022596 RepID=UPI002307852F|nr:hypothetical protein [Streptomyces sp. ACA25]MDB1087820.1 hypothetical protein [Streptomyces sp. ACA25]
MSAAAAVLVAAAALTACSGGSDDGDAAAARPAQSADSSTAPSPEAHEDGPRDQDDPDDGDDGEGPEETVRDGTAPDSSGGAPGTGIQDSHDPDRLGKPVPEDELLAPEEREFTAEERDYLKDRVPEGADPAAILDSGREACRRVGYLSRHDRAGAVEALRDGEIENAEDAIGSLCPEHRPLLTEARGKD